MADITMQHIRIEFRAGDHDYYLGAFRQPDGTTTWQVTDAKDPGAVISRAAAAHMAGTLHALSEHIVRVCIGLAIMGEAQEGLRHLHGSYKDLGAKLNGR